MKYRIDKATLVGATLFCGFCRSVINVLDLKP
jgi:hypothetical protein